MVSLLVGMTYNTILQVTLLGLFVVAEVDSTTGCLGSIEDDYLVDQIFLCIFFVWPIVVCSFGLRYFLILLTVSPG